MCKCILWDFDNTLGYRDGMWSHSLKNVLNNNGYYDFNRKDISESLSTGYPWQRHSEAHADYFDGLTWWEYINTQISKALEVVGIVEGVENNRLTLLFKDEYLRHDAWYLYDDTIRNLEKSKSLGYANIILSNHVPELEELVKYLNIQQYFKAIISSANVGYDKPNVNIYKEIYYYGNFDEYYMVGDNYEADVQGALDFGLNAILVRKENTMNYPKYSKDLDGIWKFIDS
ncbi:MAG: HAD-IA family hydrolase [Clostridiales bacterium]|nr:HAD-IA family hydrolase [Clostridiales bacterium]